MQIWEITRHETLDTLLRLLHLGQRSGWFDIAVFRALALQVPDGSQ